MNVRQFFTTSIAILAGTTALVIVFVIAAGLILKFMFWVFDFLEVL